MKKHSLLMALTLGFVVLNTHAAIINGGFETGTTEGWQLQGDATYLGWVFPDPDDPNTLHPGIVDYPFDAATNPILANAPSVRTSWEAGAHVVPTEGSYFVVLDIFQVPFADFIGPDGVQYEAQPPYTASLIQTVSLHAGDRVSGWAAYGSEDDYRDGEWLSIGSDTVWGMSTSDLPPRGLGYART